jgi:plastocyanin
MGAKAVGALVLVFLLVGGISGTHALPESDASASSEAASGTTWINVSATSDYGYQPDTFEQVATNATITVTFTDHDILQHSFTISSREGFVIPTTYSGAQLDQLFLQYPALYSSLVNGSGDTSTGTFRSPTEPGWYEFVCNVTGHFQNGMYGFIAFGENLPPNLTAPSRVGLGGSTFTPLDAGIVGGVLVLLVLGVLLWRRRRPARRNSSTRARPFARPTAPESEDGRGSR